MNKNNESLSFEEIVEKVSFEVKREPIRNPTGKDTGFDTIYRKDSGDNLGVVSRNYKLVHHQDIVESIAEKFKSNKLPEISPLSLNLTGNGARMFLHLQFKQSYNLTNSRKDPDYISPGALAINSYDRSSQFVLEGFIRRVVCSNLMMVRESFLRIRSKHTHNLEEGIIINKFVESFPNFKNSVIPKLSQMTNTLITEDKLIEGLNYFPGWVQEEGLQYLQKHKKITYEEVEDNIEVSILNKLSAWEFVNCFTYILTHTEDINQENKVKLFIQISSLFAV